MKNKFTIFSIIILFFSFGRNALIWCQAQDSEWLQEMLAPDRHGEIDAVFFVPNDNIEKIIEEFINHERKGIRAALYQITNKQIVEALLRARRRGVQIALIVDRSSTESYYEKVSSLAQANIFIKVFNGKSTLMHNKFWIFDQNIYGKSLIISGSANATNNGTKRNYENIMVRSRPYIVNKFRDHFVNDLWNAPNMCLLDQKTYYYLKASLLLES
jgi:phosphatidylserine/phosphatidylglycerophosphate/cardiolipin synthase-like enzyme